MITTEPFIHSSALCETKSIGVKTRVWAFAHILPHARIGEDCNICDHVFIENDVIVGDRVTIKCGVQLWDGIRIEDDVFVGPNSTFTNDRFPRSKRYPESFAQTVIKRGASLGANCTILPGITVGQSAMVGAGAVVTKSVPPNAIVVGNPATIIGYTESASDSRARPLKEQSNVIESGQPYLSKVKNVSLHHLPIIRDLRGDLSVGEFKRTVPFEPKRYFLVFDVPNREVRGEHAHRTCAQFLLAIKGSVSVMVDDGSYREEFDLDQPNKGLLVPAMVWATQYRYSEDAVLLVFASEYYDAADYIRDYAQFQNIVQNKQ